MMDGIIDDIQKVLRPLDQHGNPLPATTVNFEIDTGTLVNLALISAGGIVFEKIVGRLLR